MNQLSMTQPSRSRMTNCVLLVAALGSMLGLSGCAHMYENVEMGKTSLPPNYPHEFEAPANYGYFPTLWRPWPGAEAVPGQTAANNKEDEQVGTPESTENLPEPGTEPGAESTTEPGMENIFDLPENAPEMQGDDRGAAGEAPDAMLPDDLIPPENGPANPDEGKRPNAPEEGETIPDTLIPEAGATPPPETSLLEEPANLEDITFDAPQGNLIPETPEPTLAKPRPGLMMPTEQSPRPEGRGRAPIENAMRPGVRTGAKAMLIEPENALRELSGGKMKAGATRDPFADGPQLVSGQSADVAMPTIIENKLPQSTESTPWQAAKKGNGVRRTATTISATSEGETRNWRPSRTPATGDRGAVARSTNQRARENALRQVSTPKYPEQQTSYTEPAPQTPTRQVEYTSSGSTNPLR
jgi:hypothetical protein